jgi:ethanolamine utilization protein EutA
MKNLPVVTDPAALARLDGPGVLSLPGVENPGYGQVLSMAEEITAAVPAGPILVGLEADMAKALGHCLALRVEVGRPILCIDRVGLREGDYLDVGNPVGPALPVVVKTLVLGR